MNASGDIRKALSLALEESGVPIDATEIPLEHPAELSHGDYATSAALAYAKAAKMNPRELAEKLVEQLRSSTALGPTSISKIEVAGPGFINFTLAPETLNISIDEARTADMWGSGSANDGKKILVEYTDPNPFKEFHIGHLMSNAIGEAIARSLQFSGATIQRANYQGDVGPHVAKAIWGVQKLGVDPADAAQLGRAYTGGAKAYEESPDAKIEIDAINAKVYDRSDSVINEIYDTGRAASLAHFEEIYEMLGTKFDYYFYESETFVKGIEMVKAHPEIFEESEGAIVFKGAHTRVFINSKGLPTYEAKEIGLAQMKQEKAPSDAYVYITASEQDGFFEVVFEAIQKIFPALQGKLMHVSHGMMRFADGKMSSRTGNVVTGESLLRDLVESAKERAAESRADDKEALARQVAVAAIKYQILKQAAGKNIIFDREKALSLEGDSGPYLQYAYARTCAILEKAREQGIDTSIYRTIDPGVVERMIPRFPEVVERAASLYEPHLVTTYLLELASAYNSWYAQEQILDGTPKAGHKVAIVETVNRTLKNGLWILGIPAPEKM